MSLHEMQQTDLGAWDTWTDGEIPDYPNQDYKKVGGFEQYTVALENPRLRDVWDRGYPTYYLFKDKTKVGYIKGDIIFNEVIGIEAYQIKGIRISQNFLGQGLALKLYAWILNEKYAVIVADDIQSVEGAKLWEKMALSKRTFAVFWSDYRTHQIAPVRSKADLARAYEDNHMFMFTMLQQDVARIIPQVLEKTQ